MNPTPPLADVLARFPAREKVPSDDREEAALCILMLSQRLDSLSTALEKARKDCAAAQNMVAKARYELDRNPNDEALIPLRVALDCMPQTLTSESYSCDDEDCEGCAGCEDWR